MQVIAGGIAGRADIADDLPLPHPHARLQAIGDAAHMRVGGLITIDVVELDIASVAGQPLRPLDDAVTAGIDRGAERRGQVDAAMQPPRLEDRVDAIAVAAGEPAATLQRPPGQEALSGFAVGAVVVDAAVGRAEAEQLARGPPGSERGVDQLGRAAFGPGGEQLQRVARLHPLGQVDLVGEHGDDLSGGGIVEIVLARRLPDRAIKAGQGADIGSFDILFRQLDHPRCLPDHIGAAVGHRGGRSMADRPGRGIVHIDAEPIGHRRRRHPRWPHQDAELGAGRQFERGEDVAQRRRHHGI